jgi:hypothetical protein
MDSKLRNRIIVSECWCFVPFSLSRRRAKASAELADAHSEEEECNVFLWVFSEVG